MRMINMLSDEKSFKICTINGVKQFCILEKLFLRQGNSKDHTGKKFSFDEYKIRVSIDVFGNVRTYHIWFVKAKKEWYITGDCSELVIPSQSNSYQFK